MGKLHFQFVTMETRFLASATGKLVLLSKSFRHGYRLQSMIIALMFQNTILDGIFGISVRLVYHEIQLKP